MIYADDTQMYITSPASERQVQLQKLELCIKDIRTWSVENKLLLNDAKTEVIHISSRFKNSDHLSHVTVGTSHIETVSEAKNLGVVIDDSLQLKTIAVNKVTNRWRNHNNKTTKISKLNKIIELYEL